MLEQGVLYVLAPLGNNDTDAKEEAVRNLVDMFKHVLPLQRVEGVAPKAWLKDMPMMLAMMGPDEAKSVDDQQSALDFIAARKLKALDSDNLLFPCTSKLYALCLTWVELALQNKANVKQRDISATSLANILNKWTTDFETVSEEIG